MLAGNDKACCMAFNAFEQLGTVVAEPRQAFEDVTGEILITLGWAERRVQVSRGDGGIDYYKGTLDDKGAVKVFQAKYFPRKSWTDSQKQQIQESYKTVCHSKDLNLKHWYLCVPSRLTKEDIRWFDGWAKGLDVEASLMDGDDLVRMLNEPKCVHLRKMLQNWGIVGLENDGSLLEAVLEIRHEEEPSGLSYVLKVHLRNTGGRSADQAKVTIFHSDNKFVDWRHDQRFWENIGDGALNPRNLEAIDPIHPGQDVPILSIPIGKTTPLPFQIAISSWARNSEPQEQHLELMESDLVTTDQAIFARGKGPVIQIDSEPVFYPFLKFPDDEMAHAILTAIAQHPEPDEYGLILILDDREDADMATYLPSLSGEGARWDMGKGTFQSALYELTSLGWLVATGESPKTKRYRLSALARANDAFLALVDRYRTEM